jgi:hypothetical protein
VRPALRRRPARPRAPVLSAPARATPRAVLDRPH